MTDTNQKPLGSAPWSIADQLRGAMNADDFRDYMPSFLFLRYLKNIGKRIDANMEAIRSIQTVKNGEIHLQLPQQFWGQEVEIIVLPALLPVTQEPTHKKSLRGCLNAYAKPELIEQEQEAWQAAMEEKHDIVKDGKRLCIPPQTLRKMNALTTDKPT